jgi:hypothetical protein
LHTVTLTLATSWCARSISEVALVRVEVRVWVRVRMRMRVRELVLG